MSGAVKNANGGKIDTGLVGMSIRQTKFKPGKVNQSTKLLANSFNNTGINNRRSESNPRGG